jgi:hypothetical protein
MTHYVPYILVHMPHELVHRHILCDMNHITCGKFLDLRWQNCHLKRGVRQPKGWRMPTPLAWPGQGRAAALPMPGCCGQPSPAVAGRGL